MTAMLPVNYWVNGDFTNTLSTATLEYVSLEQMFTKLVIDADDLPICLAGPHGFHSGGRCVCAGASRISGISSVRCCRRSGW